MIKNYERRKREPLSDIEILFLELANIKRHKNLTHSTRRSLSKSFQFRLKVFSDYCNGATLRQAGKRISRERTRQIILRLERDIQNYLYGAGRLGISVYAQKMQRYLSEIEISMSSS